MEISSHKTRIATGLGLAAVPAVALIFQGWVLYVCLALISALTLWEFYDLFRSARGMKTVKTLGAGFTFLLIFAFTTGDLRYPAFILLGAFWTGAIIFLCRYSHDVTATFQQTMIFMAGLIYIPLSFSFFLVFNPMEILMVLGAAVVSDTAAFYTGTRWGKKKIWPKISPKKSWAGSIGGLVACTIAVAAYGLSLGNAALWQWLLLGAVLNVAAQMGDFFESAIKRSLDIKDSGCILPGHGGFLDRVDSLLLVVPVYALMRAAHPFFE